MHVYYVAFCSDSASVLLDGVIALVGLIRSLTIRDLVKSVTLLCFVA